MLRGEFDPTAAETDGELRRQYDRLLTEVVEAVGTERVVEATDLDADAVEALLDGETPDLSLTDAAAILALSEEYPDADTIAAGARDLLLLGMSTAVVDVETLASELDGDVEPSTIQAMVEGRHPMTLTEYAQLHRAIEG